MVLYFLPIEIGVRRKGEIDFFLTRIPKAEKRKRKKSCTLKGETELDACRGFRQATEET